MTRNQIVDRYIDDLAGRVHTRRRLLRFMETISTEILDSEPTRDELVALVELLLDEYGVLVEAYAAQAADDGVLAETLRVAS